MHKTLLFIALMLFTAHLQAACSGITLTEAGFSLQPDTRALIAQSTLTLTKAQAATHHKLYFYSAMEGNRSGITVHRWFFNQREIAVQSLQSQSHQWQGWSASALPSQFVGENGHWRVDILDDSYCLIGRVRLSLQTPDLVLIQAKQALQQNDITAAKLMLKKALANPKSSAKNKQRWRTFMQTELVIAEIESDIQHQNFVTASGRIEALQRQPHNELSDDVARLAAELKKQQQRADEQRQHAVEAALYALENTLSSCVDSVASVRDQLTTLLPISSDTITHYQHQSGSQMASLTIALPSGGEVTTEQHCPVLPELWQSLLKQQKSQEHTLRCFKRFQTLLTAIDPWR